MADAERILDQYTSVDLPALSALLKVARTPETAKKPGIEGQIRAKLRRVQMLADFLGNPTTNPDLKNAVTSLLIQAMVLERKALVAKQVHCGVVVVGEKHTEELANNDAISRADALQRAAVELISKQHERPTAA